MALFGFPALANQTGVHSEKPPQWARLLSLSPDSFCGAPFRLQGNRNLPSLRQPRGVPHLLHGERHPLQLPDHGRELLQHARLGVFGRALLIEELRWRGEARQLAHLG